MSETALSRDVAGLGGWAARWLWAQAAVSAVAVTVALGHGRGFAEGSPGYSLVALIQLVVFVVAGFVFLRWTWFVTANARAFGARDLRFGPWLAVGGYFIPIANLALPLQALRDVWKASVEPRDWEIVAVPAILGWWWFFWLSGNIAGIAAFRLSDNERYPEIDQVPEILTILSDGLTVAASLLLALIVRRMTALQQLHAQPAAQVLTRR